MSSRIIITTRHDEIAETCRKNCSVYRMQQAFEAAAESELVQVLCQGTERKRRVVTICGPGGSGKSILARAAYDQAQMEEEFQHKAWGMASHVDDGKGLLVGILHQLGQHSLQEKDFSQLLNILRGLLSDERYIIVIDGLETTGYWNNVLSACPDNNKSNRILVTTMSNRVTNICRDGPVYKMQPLDKSSARDLLERKVMFHQNSCPENLDKDRQMTMILETCEYLPLVIANMGDYMRGLNRNWDYDKCMKACIDDIGSLIANNNEREAFRGMKHVLNRSYTSLSPNAKACLLSLSMYSKNLFIENHVIKDHVIKGKPLIRRLLAEKLMTPEDNLANDIFSELIEHNLIVPVEVSISGQVKRFRVNRMMPQFIDSKGDYENYVTRIDIHHQAKEVAPPPYITRLYLHNSNADPPRIGEQVGVSHVRLITFHGKASKALMDFTDYTFLRVLVLENCGNVKDEHLTTVCRPQLLRYLSIRGNRGVSKLPRNIVKMRSLETLDTRDTKVHRIDMDVILLPTLLHLLGRFQITTCANTISAKITNKVQKLVKLIPVENELINSKLQTLSGFLVDDTTDFVTSLPHMPMLSKVRILCGLTAPTEKVTQDLLESLKRYIKKEATGRNSPLRSLTVDFRGRHLNFLDDLVIQPPSLLRSLKLCGKLTKLPQFILSLSDSLGELCLSGTYLGGSDLLKLGRLEKLQFLKLTGDSFEFQQQLTFERDWFCSLLRLCLDVPKVPKIVIHKHAMKGLESLQLVCNELGGVAGILHLKRLKEVILSAKVVGAEAEDLLQQVSKHSMKPKLLYADGTSRPALLARTLAFSNR